MRKNSMSRLLGATEQCCIVLQTLKPSIQINKKITNTIGNDKL